MAKLQLFAGDLFLITLRGIYPTMERNKKNTFIDTEEQKVKKSSSGIAVVKGGVAALMTDDSQHKIPAEIYGPKGPEPTRYGDWEQKGRCTDF